MLYSYGSGQQQIDGNKNAGESMAISIAMAMQRYNAKMEHIQSFTRSHWMPPLVKCLRRITPAATMVKEF